MPRIVMVCCALLGISASGWAAQKDVPYTSTPIQVSGALTQFPASGQLFTISGQSSNNTATFYAAWDDQNLYLGLDVKDEALYCSPVPPDSRSAWNNDSVELNFDLKNKKLLSPGDQDFRQWIFPLNFADNTYDAYGTGDTSDISFTGTATIAFQLNGTLYDVAPDIGYTAIIQIPWTDLALSPADAVSFGFDVAINDLDAVGGTWTFMDWSNLTKFSQVELWGTLTLTGKGGGPGPGREGGGVFPDGGSTGKLDTSSGSGRPPPSGCDCRATPVESLALGWPAALLLVLYWVRPRRGPRG